MGYFEFPHTRTYDSDLGWLIKQCKTISEAVELLEAWKEETQPTIDDLKQLYDDLTVGNLPPAMIEGIKTWLSVNALDLIGELVKSVFFEITNDGHFVAYIPDSWSDITFNTTYYDIVLSAHPEYGYGHLVLSY